MLELNQALTYDSRSSEPSGDSLALMSTSFVQTREPHSYLRAAPHLHQFTGPDREFLDYCNTVLQELDVQCPAQGHYVLVDVLVFESKLVLLDDDSFLADSAIDFSTLDDARQHIRNMVAADRVTLLPATHRRDVVFAKAGAGNYGHFLTDCLPKLMNLPGIGAPLRIHLPLESLKFVEAVEELCEWLALDAEIRVSVLGEVTRLDHCIYLGSVSKHNTRKSLAFQDMRNLMLDKYEPPASEKKRLFITRAAPDIRCLSNAAEVEGLFSAHGFDIVRPVGLTIRQQAHMFASASYIAGPIGAGLTNAMWAGAGAKILMIDNGLTDFYFWDLSSQLGQHFHWHFAAPPQRYRIELELDAYPVDVANLEASLQAMLAD